MIGSILFPIVVQAGLPSFIDGILGKRTEASEEISLKANSQRIDILEAPVIPNPEAAKLAMADISIDDDALLTETGPAGTAADVSDVEYIPKTISVYTVRKGDTLPDIAKMYDVSVNTILWANDLKKGASVKEGQTLVILPITGVKYKVQKGDTLKSIATKLKSDSDEISAFNGIESSDLVAGQTIIIPDGEIEAPAKPKATSGSGIAKLKPANIGAVIGNFIAPVTTGHFVRGISKSHHGVDIGAPTGTIIRASDGGTVLIADGNGYNGGFGKYVVIQHPNGLQTLYAHMSAVIASPGQTVSAGDTIGKVGSTGHSTGPHLHIEVHGGSNKFADFYR